MRPSQKGWINSYIELISGSKKVSKIHHSFREENITLDQDKKRYKLIQPTGLMYGHPIRPSLDLRIDITFRDLFIQPIRL